MSLRKHPLPLRSVPLSLLQGIGARNSFINREKCSTFAGAMYDIRHKPQNGSQSALAPLAQTLFDPTVVASVTARAEIGIHERSPSKPK